MAGGNREPRSTSMRDLFFACVLVLAVPAAAVTTNDSPPLSGPITSIAALHELTNEQASHDLPVSFEAIVTYYRRANADLFVQDGDASIYVYARPDLSLSLGDRVLIKGQTHASFRPEIKADSVQFLRRDKPPEPIPATFRQMIRGDLDTRRVTARGTVVSANSIMDSGSRKLYMHLRMDGGDIDAEVPADGSLKPADLLDAEVELTGAVAGKFDNKVQLTGILLQIPSSPGVRILSPSAARPSSLPVTPLSRIITNYDVQERSSRIRVQGTVTYYQPGSAVVLQNGNESLWVMTQYEEPLAIGERVDATGFPSVRNGSLALSSGDVEDRGKDVPLSPILLSAAELEEGMHAFDLVSVQGKLETAVHGPGQDQYVLVSNGHLYSAILRHPDHGPETQTKPFRDIPIGSILRITGICLIENGDRFDGPVALEVLLRSTADIEIVRGPSLIGIRNLVILVFVLLTVILAVAARQWLTERGLRRKAAELATAENCRSQILEDINALQPLPTVIAKITKLVSFQLDGAPSWCDLADGTKLGSHPGDFSQLRIVEAQIQGHDGASLGVLRAASDRPARAASTEEGILSTAAGLVTLAVETRRQYSDLIHRSEFDQLTETHNRFSFEKQLNLTLKRYEDAGLLFGLIYVDFDGFKQLNDLYGHQIGDLYLKAVASRMKNQIRPSDLLARIGGDEFVLLVRDVAHRDDIREIARRLRKCFERKFSIEQHSLEGAASFGVAIYPDDGTTRDELLNVADAAMYVEKDSKKTLADSSPRTHI